MGGHFCPPLLTISICSFFDIFISPSGRVLRKRCVENMQEIYRRTPMPKCDFNKKSHFGMGVLLQICCIFSEQLILRPPLEGSLCRSSEHFNVNKKINPFLVNALFHPPWNTSKSLVFLGFEGVVFKNGHMRETGQLWKLFWLCWYQQIFFKKRKFWFYIVESSEILIKICWNSW